MKITKRIDLNLGYTCNIKCRFCYYQESMGRNQKDFHKDLTTQEAKKWIKYFRKMGKSEIDLTGGEPTIRKDIGELATYCRSLGYKMICLITNGIMLSDEKFCRKLVEAGVNDILFSLHGPNPDIHDSLTQFKGSFQKINKAIDNMRSLGVRLRSNTVVNGVSYNKLLGTTEILKKRQVKIINFILFNPIVEAKSADLDMNISYVGAAPYLKEVIDKYKESFEKITIRYIPFCLMSGYESYVTNTPQIQYDPDEWDYYLRTYFRNGKFLWFGALCLGFFLHPAPIRFFKIDFDSFKHEAIKWSLAFKNKIKGKTCQKCAYSNICDGLWKDYAKGAGFKELKAVAGKKISDPAHFMSRNSQFNRR